MYLKDLNILAVQVHTPFFYSLSQIGHNWYFIPSSYTHAWGKERPLPDNCFALNREEGYELVDNDEIDVYIISTKGQYDNERLDVPTVFIEHCPTIDKLRHHVIDKSVPVVMNSGAYDTWYKWKEITYFKNIDYNYYKPLEYNGNDELVFTACKGFSQRPKASNKGVWEQITNGFDRELAGRYNEDLPYSIGYLDYNEMRNKYSNSRLYLNTTLIHNTTSVQEALYTKTPVVNYNDNLPYKNEKEMVYSKDIDYLRDWIEKLLDDKELATDIGEAGYERYKKSISLIKYTKLWNKILKASIDLYEEKESELSEFKPIDVLVEETFSNI